MRELTNVEKPYVEKDETGRAWFVHYCEERTMRDMIPIWEFGWSYDAKADSLTPSIRCDRCGVHGYWTEGKWG